MIIFLKALFISALILLCIYILANYLNKQLLKAYNKALSDIDVLNSLIQCKEDKAEILYKSLFFIRSQIYLAFTSDMYNDHEEHNKILNEICDFINTLEKIKSEQDAEIREK